MEDRPRPINAPRILGRFNFVSVRKELYNVMFCAYNNAAAITVAINLEFHDAEALKSRLNLELDELKDVLFEERDDADR